MGLAFKISLPFFSFGLRQRFFSSLQRRQLLEALFGSQFSPCFVEFLVFALRSCFGRGVRDAAAMSENSAL